MFKVIESHAKSEIRSVIRLLTERNTSTTDIHLQVTDDYGNEVMNGIKGRKWVRKFKDERTNVHDEERSGESSVITDDLMQAIETAIRENKRFTITTLSLEISDVSWSVGNKTVTEDHNFEKKVFSLWVPILLTAEHKEKRFANSLDFLIRYDEEGDAMLSPIVTGNETWVSHIKPQNQSNSR
ncbi:HTH_48 domain-containing protein [Trichonephila clavipes]|nr:HTH_48 domain-containing protein [Trichonephila clavipes]